MGNVEIKDLLRYAEDGNVEAVKKLAKHKDASAVSDETGNTPMHCACFQGHAEVVRTLLRAGLSANVTNLEGDTPLHLAALGKRHKCLKLLTATGKVNVVAQNSDGFTALHFCAGENHLSGAKHLLTETTPSANPRLTNNDGQTPLALAVMQGHAQMVEFLLHTDATVLNWKDVEGDTPLHVAVDIQRPDVVDMLLAYNPDLEVLGARDLTAFELAQQLGGLEVLECFKRAQTSVTLPHFTQASTTQSELLGVASTVGIGSVRRSANNQSPRQQQLFQKDPRTMMGSTHDPPRSSTSSVETQYAALPGALPLQISQSPLRGAVAPPTLTPDKSPRSPPVLGRALQAPHPGLVARGPQSNIYAPPTLGGMHSSIAQPQLSHSSRKSAPREEDVNQMHEEVTSMRADRISNALKGANQDLSRMTTELTPEQAVASVRPLFYSRYSNPPPRQSTSGSPQPPPVGVAGPGSAGPTGRRIPMAMFAPSLRPVSQEPAQLGNGFGNNVSSRFQGLRTGELGV